MSPQYFEDVRSKALTERVKSQFLPDNGNELFIEFGGNSDSVCYLGPDGFVVRGVRIPEAIAVPSKGRAAVLKGGSFLVKDNVFGHVTAFQKDEFETSHQRSLYNGTVVAGMNESPGAQGKRIMEINSELQVKLSELLKTSFFKSLRFKKINAIKNDLELQQSSLSEHTSDLKRMFTNKLPQASIT